ncbi:CHAT domain-containing protein [candidate division KSB1 bacterium]|nr:CHAT domain-containing protein [candidate division KSB1 bacterium]
MSIISYCSDFEIIARIWYLYGKIYLNLALYEMSDKSLRKAMEYALKTGNRFLIMNIEDMIRESQAMQSHPGKAAVIYANWIRECQEKGYDKLLYFNIYSLGRILLELGEYDQALVQFAAALDLAEQSQNVIQLAWTQAGIADCHLKCGHVQRAFELFNSALKTAQDKNVFQLVANIQSSMGIYYEERNQFDKAIHHYRSTIAQYEEQRETFNASELAIGFLSNKQEAYERLSECYYQKFLREKKLDYLQDIYFYEEMMRARALKQTLDTPQGIAHFHTDSSFVNLCRDYESLQRQLRRRRQNISEALLDSLIAKLQVYRYDIISEKIRLENKTKMEHGNFPPLGAVQQRLRLQTAIIYHLSNRLSYAMVIQEDSSSVVTLNVTRAEIDSLVRALMQPFHHVDSEAILNIPFEAAIAHQLYAKLFAPIEQRCRLDAHVLIIPSSSLAHLPFDMLLQKAPAEARYTPRDDPAFADFFLGLRYAFFYGPSTHILLREPLESSPRLLILANPCADSDATQDGAFTLRYRTGWRFDPLIYAEREASAIGKTCRDAKILTRRRATESAATTLAGRYSILHIASHAFADTTFELFSGLALADEKKDGDGLLMGFEIATAAFPNDLVTLSACETGRGKLIAGEGVMGLPRQFLAAGARSVIMSNWKVDDKFAAEFMPRFYQNYIEKGRSKVAALNDAKLAVLNSTSDEEIYRYRHPFFWAAFNLYGEAGQEHPPAPRQSTHHPMLIIAMFIAGMTAFVILSPERKKRVISRL